MTTSNEPNWAELGIKAGAELRKADTASTKGEALAVVVLYHALRDGYEMQYITQRTKDESDDPVSFTLATYGTNLVSENGKNDSKAISARKAAMMKDLFGLVDFTAAQDAVVSRALMSAQYLHNNNAQPTINSKGLLVVPHQFIIPAPAADAGENARTIYAAMNDKPITLDGKKGTSLRELRNRAAAAMPRKTRKAKNKSDDAGQSLLAAVKLIEATLSQINGSDEASVALSEELRTHLFNVQVAAAQYFTVDPIEQDGEDKQRDAA